MPTITVQGAHGATTSLAYDNSTGLFGMLNASLAQTIADAITAGVQHNTILPADNADGLPPFIPSGLTGEYVVSQPGVTAVPRPYDNVVVSASAAVVLGDGDTNERVLVGSGNLSFFASGAAAGSGTIVGGGGNNLVSIPETDAGAWLVSLGNGNNTVLALGSGADTISTGTGSNVIQTGNGASTISTAGSDSITAGGNIVVMSTGNDTITAAGTASINGGATLLFVGGLGSTVHGGTGSDTLTGGTGPDLLVGGSAGHNLITAGTGVATLFGGGNGDTLNARGSQPQVLNAGPGAETLSGALASGADTFAAGPGNDLITGGSGTNTFLASSGNATIHAAPGATNIFEAIHGSAGGTETVKDLTLASQVQLILVGYGVGYVPTQTLTAAGLTVSLSDSTKITFSDITSGSINKITST